MSMMLCTETVTLIRHNKTKTDDTYTCTPIDGASWYAKAAIALQDKGVRATNAVKVRIPAGALPDGIKPRTDDYLVRGLVESINSTDDLKGREYVKIMTVGDNRRGHFPHWAVIGA